MAGGFGTEADFHAVDTIDRGIARGSAAENLDPGTGKEAKMSEVMAYIFRQINSFHRSGLPYFCFVECHHA